MKLTVPNLACLTGLLMVTTGCQQYLDRSEGVTSFAGDAHAINEVKMVEKTWPRHVGDTHIHHDSERLSGAVSRYRTANSASSTSSAPTTTSNSGGGATQ